MYRAFNLTNLEDLEELQNIDSLEAQKEYEERKEGVTQNLSIAKILKSSTYAQEDHEKIKINADEIQKRIFPTYKDYDIFLSHSHKDLALVQKFAYYLTHKMRVRVFIDSEVWGYVDDLLKQVNDKYALKKKNLYDYKIANIDACNIYLMLSNAIHDVINETECLFFINTPNSINIDSNIELQNVESPWLYDELKTTSMIKKRIPDSIQGYLDGLAACRKRNKIYTDSIEPKWVRDVHKEIDGLTILPNEILLKWQNKIDTSYYPGEETSPMRDFYSVLHENDI